MAYNSSKGDKIEIKEEKVLWMIVLNDFKYTIQL